MTVYGNTVAAANAGTCRLTVTGQLGATATLPITVTITRFNLT